MPAGCNGERKAECERVAALFTETEGDGQYGFGYLGNEHSPRRPRYYPAGYTDAEGTTLPAECPDCHGLGCTGDVLAGWGTGQCSTCNGRGQEESGCGELSRDEWLLFADCYLIDLDAAGYPERYTETLGAITGYGRLAAISVDNSEGWNDHSGPDFIDSGFYVSFAYPAPPDFVAFGVVVLASDPES
jgi:hypothetical protein